MAREYCYISQTKTDYCKARTCEYVNVTVDINTPDGKREKRQLTPLRYGLKIQYIYLQFSKDH